MPKPPPNILETALKLHDRGLPIVPCNGKVPIWKDWHKGKQSREELAAELDGTKLNIALVLNKTDWIDAECDSPEAEDNLQELFGGDIPPTPTWQSRRGKHRLFRRPEGLPKRAVIEVDGIEFKVGNGKGAASIIPPSVHPDTGKRYRWLPAFSLDDVEPAELPSGVVERLKAAVAAPAVKPSAEVAIPKGKRNDTLFKLGCRLRETGLTPGAIESALLSENARRCRPPLPEQEVRSVAKSVAEQPGDPLEGVELWHTPSKEPYATIVNGDHHEHWPVRSTELEHFVRRCYFEMRGIALKKRNLEEIVEHLAAEAIFEGDQHGVFLRTAGHEGRFYLDLGNEAWQAVEIDGEGWHVVDRPAVRFRRTTGMQPLPTPVKGGSIDDIRRFVNVREEDLPLVLAFSVFALRPEGPYIVLKIHGEQGSAKSTTIRVIRWLIDPNVAPARTKPPGERELAIAVNNTWLYCLDNLSFLGAELSDAICRLATTGVGYATRKLYTDNDEVLLNAVRPVILAGIEDVGSRSDLLDRSVVIELPRISEDQRRDEQQFWAEFDEAAPGILGALLDAVSAGIRRLPEVRHSRLPRMADFLRWAMATEEALGFEPGTCERAYERNRAEAHVTAVEESPVGASLIQFMQDQSGKAYEGTAAELLDELKSVHAIDLEAMRQKSWPKNPRALSAAVGRLAPNLRSA